MKRTSQGLAISAFGWGWDAGGRDVRTANDDTLSNKVLRCVKSAYWHRATRYNGRGDCIVERSGVPEGKINQGLEKAGATKRGRKALKP